MSPIQRERSLVVLFDVDLVCVLPVQMLFSAPPLGSMPVWALLLLLQCFVRPLYQLSTTFAMHIWQCYHRYALHSILLILLV